MLQVFKNPLVKSRLIYNKHSLISQTLTDLRCTCRGRTEATHTQYPHIARNEGKVHEHVQYMYMYVYTAHVRDTKFTPTLLEEK